GYLATGEATLVQDDFSPLSAGSAGPLFEYVMNYALLGDAAEAAAAVEPIGDTRLQLVSSPGETTDGSAPDSGNAEGTQSSAADPSFAAIADMVPLGVLFILFFVITTSSSYLLQSVSAEKENRTAEVLLVTVKPRELMLGKVLGLGAVALMQIGIWIAGSLLVLYQYAGIPDLAAVGLSAGLIGWLLAFLALGYVAYGALVAALGAMVPSQREGTQLLFVVLFPLILPVWFNYALTADPNGWLSVALSLFPLSAPVAMITRLAAGAVPLWQPLAALVGLALIAYFFVLIGARLFRSDTLLSTQAMRWGRLVDEFRRSGRA
ncbi:MAG TPA: ABC transporter permease, partial [Thermoleophilia bacterium]|nr:ABC transporter permease [Thermoleophilia bacterium]